MGGLAFILVPTIIYIAGSFILPDMRFSQNILIILLAYVGYGLIGFLDDYIIVVKKDNEGLKPGAKFLLQAVLAIIFFMIYRSGSSTEIWIPLADIYIDLGWAYFLLVVLMFTAETNAVNLTDGIDGLCAGLMVIALVPFAVFASVQHQYPVLVLIIMVIASLIGYLRFNLHPAKIFMGTPVPWPWGIHCCSGHGPETGTPSGHHRVCVCRGGSLGHHPGHTLQTHRKADLPHGTAASSF